MSATRWFLVLTPAILLAGAWTIAICRANARNASEQRDQREQHEYDQLFTDIINRLTITEDWP